MTFTITLFSLYFKNQSDSNYSSWPPHTSLQQLYFMKVILLKKNTHEPEAGIIPIPG